MVSIQEMCARIGIVTKKGLTGTIKKYYPKYLLYIILAISFPSIVLNIGADIAGMGAVGNLLIPKIPAFLFSIIFTIILMYSIIFWSYNKIASFLSSLQPVQFYSMREYIIQIQLKKLPKHCNLLPVILLIYFLHQVCQEQVFWQFLYWPDLLVI